jgi:hypothetical protein
MSVSLLSSWQENKSHTKPEDGEDANPEEFPPGLGDRRSLLIQGHEEPIGGQEVSPNDRAIPDQMSKRVRTSEEHEEGDDGGERGKWYKHHWNTYLVMCLGGRGARMVRGGRSGCS